MNIHDIRKYTLNVLEARLTYLDDEHKKLVEVLGQLVAERKAVTEAIRIAKEDLIKCDQTQHD